ncbi:hypothetical protein HGB07_07590 [Candidatus Roizmanbacteria bacterium]|nr:hypothetical protein [Candidatus Roizmanbacteria bacterium]
MKSINTAIAMNPANIARNAHVNALSPSVGLIFSSCMRISGAGNAPSLRASDNSFALSIVNDPSI